MKSIIIAVLLTLSAYAQAWNYGNDQSSIQQDQPRYGNRYGNDQSSIQQDQPRYGNRYGNDQNSIQRDQPRYGNR